MVRMMHTVTHQQHHLRSSGRSDAVNAARGRRPAGYIKPFSPFSPSSSPPRRRRRWGRVHPRISRRYRCYRRCRRCRRCRSARRCRRRRPCRRCGKHRTNRWRRRRRRHLRDRWTAAAPQRRGDVHPRDARGGLGRTQQRRLRCTALRRQTHRHAQASNRLGGRRTGGHAQPTTKFSQITPRKRNTPWISELYPLRSTPHACTPARVQDR